MCLVKAILVLLSLVPGYQGIGDDGDDMDLLLHRPGHVSIAEEQALFLNSGVCAADNRSGIEVCAGRLGEEVTTLAQLKHTNCRCDDQCLEYGDCCIDGGSRASRRQGTTAGGGLGWKCRDARGVDVKRVPFYVYQQCPASWEDEIFKGMCEVEAVDRQRLGLDFDHLQDMPVISETTRRFYRNVYCAVCNGDVQLYRWDAYTYCNGDSMTAPYHSVDEDLDFSEAVYNPRTMNYRKVKVGTKFKSCQIVVRNFELKRLVPHFGARLCKPIVDSCPDDVDAETRHKCKKYSSYVYNLANTRIYRNFHCVICNGIPLENISCLDRSIGLVYTEPPGGGGRSSLSLLFDFNFRGGQESVGSSNPCLMHEGQVWDPIFRRCQNFTCGALYQKDGFQCRPRNDSEKLTGIKNNCLKIILESDQFFLLSNGSVYINKTEKILTSDEYEVHIFENKIVTKIAVCLDSNQHLLPYSKAHSWLSIITLSISITCLILHLVVYSLLEKLRNTPGKVLMSLSASLLCGHIFLLLGPHFTSTLWMCYINGVATHFGYLSAFSWMSVMAFDIHATFSVTQSHNTRKQRAFVRYSLYAWMSSLTVIILSVTIDNSVPYNSDFRPKYGDPICWLNSRKGLLIFFVVPATILLFANIALFTVTAFHIRKVSRQTKMVNNFSDKVRYYLYLKLAVVLGLTWVLGLVAGITQMDAFWYPFIVLNGLQGSLIFVAFTIKRSILHMLAVKLKFRSSKYRIGKQSGIKAAMYSSLSNLTLQTTTTSSQIPSLSENKEMLKAVRRLNPDAAIEQCKL